MGMDHCMGMDRDQSTQSTSSQSRHLGILQGSQKHLVQAQGVCAISVHNIVGVDDIPPALTHLVLLRSDQRIRML